MSKRPRNSDLSTMAGTEYVVSESLISIIVPCFNQGRFLSEALESVLLQTYKTWECIIVNDGSSDDTESIATLYVARDDRFKYISKLNGGLSSARNKGITNSTGEFILPLDADDVIGNEYLQLAMEAFLRNEELKLAYCLAEKFGMENCPWHLKDYSYKRLLIDNCIFCSAIFRKKSWDDAGGYDESLKQGWEDWDFWLKILDDTSEVHRIPKVLFYYRVKEVSMVKAMPSEYVEQTKWRIFLMHSEAYRKHFPPPQIIVAENENLQLVNSHLISSTSYKIGNKAVNIFSGIKRVIGIVKMAKK